MNDPISKRQWRVLRFLVDLFDELNIRYFIDDGLAAIIYGSKRKLYDIDLCFDDKSMNKLKKEFNDLAFKPYQYDKYSNCKLYLVTLRINGVPIDACMEKNAYICREYTRKKICLKLHNQFKDTRIINFRGIKLRVTNPENLVIQKIFMNRKTDKFDAKAIMKNNVLDKRKIAVYAKMFAVEKSPLLRYIK